MVNVSNSFDLLNQSQGGAAAKKRRSRQKGKSQQADAAVTPSPVKDLGQQQTSGDEGGEWHQQGQHPADAAVDLEAGGVVREVEVEKEQPQSIVSANGSTETPLANGDASKETDTSDVPAVSTAGESQSNAEAVAGSGGGGKKKGKNKGNKAKGGSAAAGGNDEGIKAEGHQFAAQQQKEEVQQKAQPAEPPAQSEVQRIAGLEAVAAKEAVDAQGRANLWSDWAAHATTAASWREILLKSRGLELTLESCLDEPLTADHLPALQTLLYATLPSTEAAQVVAQVVWDLSQVLEGIPRAATQAGVQLSAAEDAGATSQGLLNNRQVDASADADDGWSTAGGKSGSKGGSAGKRGGQQGGKQQQQQRAKAGVVPGAGEDALRDLAKRALSFTVAAVKGGGAGWAIRDIAAHLRQPSVCEQLSACDQKISVLKANSNTTVTGSNSSQSAVPETDSSATAAKQSLQFSQLVSLTETRLRLLLTPLESSEGHPSHEVPREALRHIRNLTAEIVRRKSQVPIMGQAQSDAGRSSSNVEAASEKQQGKRQGKGAEGGRAGKQSAGQKAEENRAVMQAQLEEVDKECNDLHGKVEAAEKELNRLQALKLVAELKRNELRARLGLPPLAVVQPGGRPTTIATSTATTAVTAGAAIAGAPASASDEGSAAAAAAVGVVEEGRGAAGREEEPALSATERHQIRCAQKLGIVHMLESLLLRPAAQEPGSASDAQLWVDESTVASVVGHAVEQHLRALSSLLQARLQQLQAAGSRLYFAAQRLQQIQDEKAGLQARGKSQLAAALSKPLDAVKQMHKTRLGEVESLRLQAEAVEAALQRPELRSAVALLPPLPAVHECLQQIGVTLHQVHMEYTTILSGSPPTPSPAPVTAAPSNTHADEAAPSALTDAIPAAAATAAAAPAVTVAPVGGLGGERLPQGPRRTNTGGAWGKGKVVSEIGSNRGVNGTSSSGSSGEGSSGAAAGAWGGVTGQQATGWAVGEGGGLGGITSAAVSEIPSSADAAVHVAAGNGDANEPQLSVGSTGF